MLNLLFVCSFIYVCSCHVPCLSCNSLFVMRSCHVSCHWLIVCSLFTGVPCPVISLVYLSPNVCHVSLSSIVSCDQVYVHVFLFHATSCFCFMFYLMFINIKLHLGSIYNLPPVDHYIQWHTFWFILWFGIGSL